MSSESLGDAAQKSEQGPKDIRWFLVTASLATVASFGVLIYSQLEYQHQVQAARNQAAQDATLASSDKILAERNKRLAESYKRQADESKASAARDKLQAQRMLSQSKKAVDKSESWNAWQQALAIDKSSYKKWEQANAGVESYLPDSSLVDSAAAPIRITDVDLKKASLFPPPGKADAAPAGVVDLELRLAALCSVVGADFTDSKVREALGSKGIAGAKQALQLCAPYLQTTLPYKPILTLQANPRPVVPVSDHAK